MGKAFEYILKFTGDTKDVDGKTQGLQGTLKKAAVAAGALFSVAMVAEGAKAVYEYGNKISELKSNIQSFTNLTGAGLNKATGAAQAISNVFDQDVNGVVAAGNVLAKQFGTDMNNSLELIKQGFVAGANTNEDFLDQVKEYSPHFKAAGLDAENMIAVMSSSANVGIFSDKGADVIKEAGLRLREMTTSTTDALRGIGINSDQMQRDLASGNISIFDAMKQVSLKLAEFPAQSAKVGTAIADIFGGPGEDAGLEYIKMLGNMDLSMGSVMKNLTDAQKAQLDWTNAQQEFNTIGAQVFGGQSTLIMKVKTGLLDMVNAGIKGAVSLANYFIDLYNESTLFRGAIQLTGANIKNVFEVGKLIVRQFLDNLSNAGKLLKAVFTLDFKGVKDAMKSVFVDTVDNIKETGANMAGNYAKAIENTLTPRKKIALITIGATEAEAAGAAAGAAFAKGAQSTMTLADLNLTRGGKMTKLSSKRPPSVTASTASPAAALAATTNPLNVNNALMEMLIEKHNRYSEAVANSAASISGVFSSIGDAIGGAAGSWMGFAGQILGQIPQIIQQITALTNAQLASSMTITAGKQTEAAGSAAASAASLPFPLNIAAMIGAVASVVGLFASFKSMPKLANGGIASGLTSVMVGDYANAKSNPEVIAPLSKLRGMLEPAMQPAAIRVYGSFSGRGRDFSAKIQQEDDFQRRTGGR